ncbi:MAG: hypothetical protein R3D59_05140 [Paracoccaceae bacterium]
MITGHGAVISRTANGTGAGPLSIHRGRGRRRDRGYVADAIAACADAPDPYQMFWLMHRTRRRIGNRPMASCRRPRRSSPLSRHRFRRVLHKPALCRHPQPDAP